MDLELEPVDPGMGKGDGELAVGEDLHFQERWRRFERAMWVVFGLVVIAALLGAFGHGWLAEASREAADGSLRVEYERIERVGAPSLFVMRWRGAGDEPLHVGDALVRELGAARVIPEPARSVVGDGVTYTFPVAGNAKVELALEPRKPGVHTFDVRRGDGASVRGRILVLP